MLTDWQTQFPHCEPVGYHLRVAFPDRWVRFHSLPESKRYPESATEYTTVLERHNRILGEIVREGEAVCLLTTGYSSSTEPIRSYAELLELDPGAVPWRTVAMHHEDGNFTDPNFWHVFVSTWHWSPGTFDPLVRLVADDVLANIMIVAPDCKWLLHPYDGGMDVILESKTERDKLKALYPSWLPFRPDGL